MTKFRVKARYNILHSLQSVTFLGGCPSLARRESTQFVFRRESCLVWDWVRLSSDV